MNSTGSRVSAIRWIAANGHTQLELLLRILVFQSAAPLLLVDKHHRCREASTGICRDLRLPREKFIGLLVEDLTNVPPVGDLQKSWSEALAEDSESGLYQLVRGDGTASRLGCTLRRNLFADWSLLAAAQGRAKRILEYAPFLLDNKGQIVAWHGGAERVFGYTSDEVIGQHVTILYPNEDALIKSQDRLDRAAHKGHSGSEGWQIRKDKSRFWANLVMLGLRDQEDHPQGFACVIRDFTQHRRRKELARRDSTPLLPSRIQRSVAGMMWGGQDGDPEVNDAFLDMVGYSREDLNQRRLWQDLNSPEYLTSEQLAHEETFLFNSCAPYRQDLIRKDKARVPVRAVTALLQLCPHRWITLFQDLREVDQPEGSKVNPRDFGEIIGNSFALRKVLKQVEVVAPTDATVMILGETGTGKELLSRAIHRLSPRNRGPFITLNCAAIPAGLLESELFGYERGAFTGALSQKIGRFELANHGTLFLDEIGDIPFELQPKLLRAIQEKSFERLGGTNKISIDVRLVVATNRKLAEMLDHNLFRSDLYYRLNVFPIVTPPLRNRPEDIPLLVEHFTREYAAKLKRSITGIPVPTMRALIENSWPGNIRELKSFIERSVILSDGPNLSAPLTELVPTGSKSLAGSTLEAVEHAHILCALRESGWVISRAAIRLGVPRTTLHALMKTLGIVRKPLDAPLDPA